jgi:hypothetical protein
MVNVYCGKAREIKEWLQFRPFLMEEDVVIYRVIYGKCNLEMPPFNGGVFVIPSITYRLAGFYPSSVLTFAKVEKIIDIGLCLSENLKNDCEKIISNFHTSLPICFSFKDKELDRKFGDEMGELFERVGYCSTSLF